MTNTFLYKHVFSSMNIAVAVILVATLFLFPRFSHAAVTQSDISAQESVVTDNLVLTMTEYVKLLQLMLIDKLEDRLHDLRVARGLT